MSTQTENNITLTDAAAALIKADVAAFKKDRKRYSDYVAEMEVSAEDVADHVALFREAYKAALPKASKDEIKAYATKVRNGLNYWVGKALTDEDADDVTNLLTADGLKTITDGLITPDEILKTLMLEVARRAKN